MKAQFNLENIPEINLDFMIEEINKNIFDEKIWIWEKMWKVAEVTYSYTSKNKKTWNDLKINWKKINLNFTLFCEIWWLNLDDFDNITDDEKIIKILQARDNLEKKIFDKMRLISIFKKNIKNLNLNWTDKLKAEIIYDSLNEKNDLLEYCLYWMKYELEKAWIKPYFSKMEEIETDLNLRRIDKKVFWWQVVDNPTEINLSYNNLVDFFAKNKEKLTKQEQESFKIFIKKIASLPWCKKLKITQKPKNRLSKYNNLTVKDIHYIPIFNEFTKMLWLGHKAVQNSEAWSISDWPNTIEFPTSKEFKTMKVPRILSLNSHEIEAHSVNDENNKKILWNIRWAKSTEKEEWLAILMENLLKYGDWILKVDRKTWKKIIDLEKCDIPDSIVKTLIWEICNDEELLEYFKLKSKMWWLKISPKEAFLRAKRSNKSWVQHKDTSYARWFIKVVKSLNKSIKSWKWINFEDLFLGKFWIKDLEKAKKIKEAEEIQTILPQFNSERILYIMETWDTSESNFLKDFQKKFPFINLGNMLAESITSETNEKILKIIWELKKT